MSDLPTLSDLAIPVAGVVIALIALAGVSLADHFRDRNDDHKED